MTRTDQPHNVPRPHVKPIDPMEAYGADVKTKPHPTIPGAITLDETPAN